MKPHWQKLVDRFALAYIEEALDNLRWHNRYTKACPLGRVGIVLWALRDYEKATIQAAGKDGALLELKCGSQHRVGGSENFVCDENTVYAIARELDGKPYNPLAEDEPGFGDFASPGWFFGELVSDEDCTSSSKPQIYRAPDAECYVWTEVPALRFEGWEFWGWAREERSANGPLGVPWYRGNKSGAFIPCKFAVWHRVDAE